MARVGTLARLQLLQLFSQVDQIDSQIAARAVVVGVCISSIEVSQSCDSFGMSGSHRTQLFAAERVPSQHGPVQLECIEDGENVVTQTIGRIHRVPGGQRSAGRAEAAPCDAVNMVRRRQLGSELIKYMSRVSKPRQQNQGSSRATPIEDLQLDVVPYRYVLCAMRRRVEPRRLFSGTPEFEGQRPALRPCPADGCPVGAEFAIVTAAYSVNRKPDVATIQRE